jgi:hypothetical protein
MPHPDDMIRCENCCLPASGLWLCGDDYLCRECADEYADRMAREREAEAIEELKPITNRANYQSLEKIPELSPLHRFERAVENLA